MTTFAARIFWRGGGGRGSSDRSRPGPRISRLLAIRRDDDEDNKNANKNISTAMHDDDHAS
jgi:hypothetical protein